MSQRFVFHEDFLFPIKIIRSLIWSVLMAVLWALPFAVFLLTIGAIVTFLLPVPPADTLPLEGLNGIVLVLIFFGGCACAVVAFTIGAVAGLIVAFRAAPDAPFWPFDVPFWKRVLKWSATGAIVLLLGAVVAVLVSYDF